MRQNAKDFQGRTDLGKRTGLRNLSMVLAAVGASLSLAACGDPLPEDEGVEPLGPEAPSPLPEPAPNPEPLPAPTPPSGRANDNTTAPTTPRTSEESVRPDSETLFY